MVGTRMSKLGRWAAIAAVVAMAAMWLYIFSGLAERDPPDQLDDPTFSELAEPRCAASLDDLAALPGADLSATAADRADVLDQANGLLTTMVDDLATITVDDDHDRELVGLWVADWRHYIEDRQEFADELRIDADAELLVTARGGRQITLTVDRFATVNDMESCATPLDA